MSDQDRLDRIERAIDKLDGKIEGVARIAHTIGAACLLSDDDLAARIMDGLAIAEERARALNAHDEEVAMLVRFRQGFAAGSGKLVPPRGRP